MVKSGVGKIFVIGAIAFFSLPAMPNSPAAPGDEVLGEFRDWFAVSYTENGEKVCYMVTRPKKQEGNYTRRGPTYVQVTRRKGEQAPDIVSVQAGYRYKEASEVAVIIDGETLTMFTDGETAWAYDEAGDEALVAAMAKGRRMVIKGTSWRGTETTDTYSLMGFILGQTAIGRACEG